MCEAPPEVEHSRPMGSSSERYPVNSIVRYQCDAGYTQRHLPVIRCKPDGQWEEPQVECTEGEFSGKYGNVINCQRAVERSGYARLVKIHLIQEPEL